MSELEEVYREQIEILKEQKGFLKQMLDLKQQIIEAQEKFIKALKDKLTREKYHADAEQGRADNLEREEKKDGEETDVVDSCAGEPGESQEV